MAFNDEIMVASGANYDPEHPSTEKATLESIDKNDLNKAYTTDDSASTTINDTDYIPMSDANGNRKKSLWSNIVEKIKAAFGIESSGSTYLKKDGTWGAAVDTTKVPLIANAGITMVNGNGQYSWAKIATLTTTSYCNGPVVFEVSQRGYAFSVLQVSFYSSSGSDPGLDYFITNNDNHYYIKKVATSTWELYGKYSEAWGGLSLHRITGYRVSNGVTVTVNMINISEPTGITQVSYGGNVNVANYATTSGRANYAADAGKTTYMSIPRVAESCNNLPSAETVRFREYTEGANYNLPTNAWYQILEIRSLDTNYGTQLALSMTTDSAYYRKYSRGTWGSWKSLINTWRGIQNNLTSTSTTDSLSAAQGKALNEAKQPNILGVDYSNTSSGIITTGIAVGKILSAVAANWDGVYCVIKGKNSNGYALIECRINSNNTVITNTALRVHVNYLP